MIQFKECEELVKNNFKLVYTDEHKYRVMKEYELNDFQACIGYKIKDDDYNIIHLFYNHINKIGYISDDGDYYVHPERKENFNEFIRLIESLKMKSELKDELKINAVKPKIIKI